MKQRLQFRIEIRYVFHFVIRFQLLADFCDNHRKCFVNLHTIFSGFNVFLVLCMICENSARGYFDLRCAVRDGGHIYVCNLCIPRYWDGGCWGSGQNADPHLDPSGLPLKPLLDRLLEPLLDPFWTPSGPPPGSPSGPSVFSSCLSLFFFFFFFAFFSFFLKTLSLLNPFTPKVSPFEE